MNIRKDNTRAVLSESDRRISSKLRRSCLLVEKTAKELCAVLTGTLRRSILSNWFGAKGTRVIEWEGDPAKKVKRGKTEIDAPKEKKGVVGTNVEYAPFVELGTSRMAAQPYLQPALEKNRAEIRRIFRQP